MSVEAVARFAADTRWVDLPEPVRARMRVALTDTVGCILAGRKTAAYAAASTAADRIGGSALQAFALAVAASALDFDDGHYEGGGVHLGSVILPALLASTSGETTAKQLLEALAVGYEIAIRAGYLLAPRAASDPYHTSGAPTCLGAAAAVARLIGLGAAGIRRAVRIASAHAPLATLQLPMVKESIGWGAATAVGAAQLAAAGFDGSDHAVQVAPILGIAPTPFDGVKAQESFVARLGQDWQSPAAYLKPYPCCRAIHAALDATVFILRETGWNGDAVARVDIATMPGVDALNFLPPVSPEHAQFSFPFAIGCLLTNGAVQPSAFLERNWTNPAILEAGSRVVLTTDAGLGDRASSQSYAAAVTITVGGAQRQLRVDHALGSVAQPLPTSAIAAKFLGNAGLAMSAPAAAALLQQLDGSLVGIDVAALTLFLTQPMEFLP